jgi:acetyl coenzyme A synthetase (ADP forming)-like protein
MSAGTADYPAGQSVNVALRDGSTVHVRPVRREDRDAIAAFLQTMTADSLYFRAFGTPNIQRLSDWSVDVDYADRYGLVATTGPEQSIVAHAAYVRTSARRAEVAFEVADQLHGQGIGTLLLGHLAGVAAQHGITKLTAIVMPNNYKMIDVLRDSGFPVTQRSSDGATEIDLPTSVSEETLEAYERREQTAAISALRTFLAPRTVAVIGASRRAGTVGSELLVNLIQGGFAGRIFPVNPTAERLQGLRTYPSVADVPEPVELAVVIVPSRHVADVARQCAAGGVRSLVVISAGFAEAGPDGEARQAELLEICRTAGMRLIGPNCLGVLNTDPDVRMNATFAGGTPPVGRIGFLSQSGGVGIALMEASDRLSLGLSTFISVGNKADISGNDLIEYWENDPGTDLILMYLESFGNPRRFARIARRVGVKKPILAVKSGRSPAGARATSSHTGSLVSASDVTVDALFRQAGVIRADTIGELLDTAALLSSQPAPRGNRVAVVTNGGGPGILAVDACHAAGLAVPELSAELKGQISEFLSSEASVGNPIDMIATASAADYRRTIELLIRSGECDAVIAIFVPPLVTVAADVAREIDVAAQDAGGVTLASVFMDRDAPARTTGARRSAARFAFPEDAVRAIGHAARWTAWRDRPRGTTPELDGLRPEEAAGIVEQALAAGKGWLSPDEVGALLDCYGLPLAVTRIAEGPEEAVVVAEELGHPVVLKAIAADLVHKTDAGGVRVGLRNSGDVRTAALEIRDAVAQAGHRLQGYAVQRMAEGGVELLLGVVQDASFGPVLVCGAGGTSAELLQDVSVRITPLTDVDAREMLRSLRTFPLLDGYRGQPKCDTAAVEDVLLRLNALVETHPEIAELDANPLIAMPDGALIVDARVRVQRPAPSRPLSALRQ